jgi:SAM-dependent methyltransferase
MNLESLKQDWEHLAKQDALWAILTDERKVGGKWDVAEFMATGEAEVGTVLDYLAGANLSPNFSGEALDFGCGVGRLTQALAQRFASCVGVDISQEMIEKAESFNRYARCRYVTSSGTRLPFADASFSFIYSNIVLQHVPPRYSSQYLREFVRLLEPSGVLVFGVQDFFAGSLLGRIRSATRVRTRIKEAFGGPMMKMYCLSEREVRHALGFAKVADIRFTNSAAKDFNGKLAFLQQAPAAGYVSKQYCVVKQP